jgi:metal-responsive CopG/Arc/MetJ family transcriptional regulator
MRNTKSVTISLPPEQLKTAERLAKKESRTMSELFREALRRYEQQEEWRPSPAALAQFGQLVKLMRQDTKNAGMDRINEAEIEAEVEAARTDVRIKARRTSQRSRR